MEFCMDYVKRKNVTNVDLYIMECRLKDELDIRFKFTHYYDDTLEITIKKGDNTKVIEINRWFQSKEQAYSEIKNCIKSAYSNMLYVYNYCLTLISINDLVENLNWRC